jgi:hypothetical protein
LARLAIKIVQKDLPKKLLMKYPGSFQNRNYLENPPLNSTVKKGDTSTFKAAILTETQPVPVPNNMKLSATILALGGGVLLVEGYAFLLGQLSGLAQNFSASTRIAPHQVYTLADPILNFLAAWAAVNIGSTFLGRSYRFFNLFRWQSDVVYLDMQGTYTASKIGLGDGRGGQLHSSRVSLQSDTHLVTKGFRLISETVELEGNRTIVSATTPPNFEERIKRLVAEMHRFKDSSGKLASIDIHDESFSELASANAQLTKGNAAARAAGHISGARAARAEAAPSLKSPESAKPAQIAETGKKEKTGGGPAEVNDIHARLERLKQLLDSGIINQAEYDQQRASIIKSL